MSVIPFASQRGNGPDLARHLMNAQDNEFVEVRDIRGSIADDLHGAFAEWEAQAAAMTKCRNFLYSLSINPDPEQGPMHPDLYDDYIDRAEKALGLAGQGRAIVCHIKTDQNGVGREHYHVVWSRIDVQECKAIHMAFDYDKLMTVSREFARDHGRELPPGYHRLEDRKRQEYRQLSLYEKHQQDTTGLSREERTEIVTDLWRQRDDAKSFVSALDYHGYILATGIFKKEHEAAVREVRRTSSDPSSFLDAMKKHHPELLSMRGEHDERLAKVTTCWQTSDGMEAFLAALHDEKVLAPSRRPFVLVDVYGHVNSLPKLIADKAGNTAALREFLGDDYDPQTLPSVAEAKKSAADRRGELKSFKRSQEQADKLDQLRTLQDNQRARLEADVTSTRDRQERERANKTMQQLEARAVQKEKYTAESERIFQARDAAKPKGLAGILAKASGYELIRRQIHKYQDHKRNVAFQAERDALRQRQHEERLEQQRSHQMQLLDLERKRRAMEQTHAREQKSLQTSFVKDRRMQMRKGHEHMPSMGLALKPPGRPAAPHKAMQRYTSPLAAELREEKETRRDTEAKRRRAGVRGEPVSAESDLRKQFKRAAADTNQKGGDGDSGRMPNTDDHSRSDHSGPDRGGRKR